MLEINIGPYLGATDVLTQITFVAQFEPRRMESDTVRNSIAKMVRDLLNELSAPEFAMCKISAERLLENVRSGKPAKSLMSDAQDLRIRIHDQMESVYLLSLSEGERTLYSPSGPAFGDDVDRDFPSAGFDISEAAKCLALGRFTASVFHLMRVMEIGIFSVSRCLGLPGPTKPSERNWGKILQKIKAEMEERSAGKSKRWIDNTDKDFFQTVFVSLDAVRSAWRNTTMHVENKYTEEEAKEVFAASRRFMVTLSSRLDEGGAPSA